MTDKADATSSGQTTPVPGLQGIMNPENWVDDHGDYLFHFALSRLRDPILSEDLVQEALLAALKAQDRFAGRSSERSWLAGILKNKILDHYRKLGRETSFTDLEFFAEEEERSFESGLSEGHWTQDQSPNEWNGANESLDRDEFWKAFNCCVSKLPQKIAQVFLLREVDDVSSEKICQTLNISPNNLWVMLHRARLALRKCLETSWFRKPAKEES
jgi:RNA polymerase sigma-70 factor (ECF subfamily)